MSQGLRFLLPKPSPLLTKEQRLRRVDWCRKYMKTNWNQVIFSDETSVQLFSNMIKYWMPSRNQLWRPIPKNRTKIMACVTGLLASVIPPRPDGHRPTAVPVRPRKLAWPVQSPVRDRKVFGDPPSGYDTFWWDQYCWQTTQMMHIDCYDAWLASQIVTEWVGNGFWWTTIQMYWNRKDLIRTSM